MILQSFRRPVIGDTATFTLPAGAFAVGFISENTNFPPTVTITDTVANKVVVTLNQACNTYFNTRGSTFKFTVTAPYQVNASGNSIDGSVPCKEIWLADTKLHSGVV